MEFSEFAAVQREVDAWIGLERYRRKGLLVQNKEAGFHISSFQSELLLTFVFGGNTYGPLLFPRRHSRFLRTERAFGDHPGSHP